MSGSAAISTLPMRRAARFDATRRYRYGLRRRWGAGPACCFIMLNPSAADESVDDPTIRRCIGFARDWGFPALEVVNLFAWRTHVPRELQSAPDPIGPGGDQAIRVAVARADTVVCAWGASLQDGWASARSRVADVARSLNGVETRCLGRTKAGHPRHPLYVSTGARLESYAVDSIA